jgi:hypothetical protein
MNERPALVALLLVAAALAACGVDVEKITGTTEANHPRVLVLADTSCDQAGEVIEEAGTILAEAVRETAVRRGTVLADVIQEDALETTSYPLDRTFEPSNDVPADNPTLAEEDLELQAEKVVEQTATLFQRRRGADTCRSDLLGAYLAAGRAFDRFEEGDFRLLISVSNGVIAAEGVNFRQGRLTQERMRRLLRRLAETNRIPDLRGVRVALVGTGRDVRGVKLKTPDQRSLEDFWREFFARAKAEIVYLQPRMVELPPLHE